MFCSRFTKTLQPNLPGQLQEQRISIPRSLQQLTTSLPQGAFRKALLKPGIWGLGAWATHPLTWPCNKPFPAFNSSFSLASLCTGQALLTPMPHVVQGFTVLSILQNKLVLTCFHFSWGILVELSDHIVTV